jgi:two-component system, NtrC family, response regulator PilR
MEFEKSLQIALDVASDSKPPEKPATETSADALSSPSTAPAVQAETSALAGGVVREAMNLISMIAAGKDPFTSDPLSLHRPQDNPETIKSLCVALTYLANQLGLRQHAVSPTQATGGRGSMPLENYIQQIERREILLALEATRYNKTEAARNLGITFRALRYKLEQFGIE